MRLKYVFRRLAKSPMFTVVALVTLALGIGANTAIFSIINGVLLKPLSYSHPEQLINLNHAAPGLKIENIGAAPFLYFTYREESRTLQDAGLWRTGAASVTGLGEPEQVNTLNVTDGILPILGVQPALGRLFARSDDKPDAPETVILSQGYWRQRFGGDASAVGRRLVVDGKPRDIIGVLPAGFRFLDVKASLVLPLRLDRGKVHLGNFSYSGIARLKPGVSIAEANSDAARMIQLGLRNFPPVEGFTLKMFEDMHTQPKLRPLKEEVVGDIGSVLWVLMGTIGLVLLIACANVANLLLVRADGRQQELAVRAALGASRAEIARELLWESVTLGIGGGAIGLGLAYAGLRLLMSLAPENLPRLEEISMDGTVLLFALVISLLAGLLFGLIPVLKYAGPQLNLTLRSGDRSATLSRERRRARGTLVVVQIALALVLLISSGLMIRTFQALRNVQPGFTHPETIQTLRISIPESQVRDTVAVMRMEQAILEKITAIPGVQSAGFSSTIPTESFGWHDPIFAEDRAHKEGDMPTLRRYKFVSPGVLRTLGNSIIAGRDFTWTDLYERRLVAMVTENLARELWGSPGAAVGKRIRQTLKAPWREVVGVVTDERDDGVNRKAPATALWPMLMDNFSGDKEFVIRGPAVLIRTNRAGSSAFITELGQAIWSVNPNLPLAQVKTLDEIYRKSLARTSFTLLMLGIAAGMALVLGVVGIYGVVSYSVAQRTREIGIRLALGAQTQELTRMFVSHGARLAALGVVCGLAAAAMLMRLLSTLLFEVRPVDPATYAAAAAALVGAALLASYVPALRASAVDPVQALRSE
jgi:predicted permease